MLTSQLPAIPLLHSVWTDNRYFISATLHSDGSRKSKLSGSITFSDLASMMVLMGFEGATVWVCFALMFGLGQQCLFDWGICV
jgi:hypothetical protein